jgi:hypothetical protein
MAQAHLQRTREVVGSDPCYRELSGFQLEWFCSRKVAYFCEIGTGAVEASASLGGAIRLSIDDSLALSPERKEDWFLGPML